MRFLCALALRAATFVLWAALLAAPPARAACPPLPATLLDELDDRAAALHRLDAHAQACAHDAVWHAQRGALLLELGRVAEAAENLERALLLDPLLAGARIDYADALAALGDLEAASELATSLLRLPDLPAAARRHLEARLRHWRQAGTDAATPWQRRIELAAQFGWERNLNGGPAADTILLTPPEGSIELPIAASQRPRAGMAAQTSAEVQALRPLGDDWSLFLRGHLRLRDTTGSDSDYLLGNFDAYLLHRRNNQETSLQLARLEQRFGGRHLLAETRLAAQRQWLGAPCRPRLGLDTARRDYPGAPQLGGKQLGLRAGLMCVNGAWRTDLDLRAAIDKPLRTDRPGGAQRWLELQWSATWQGTDYRAEASASLGQVLDREGYSLLLNEGEAREILRQALRLELARPLAPHWEAVLAVEHFRQRANLALFALQNHGLYFGVRHRY
ncbi:hypothetical protein [Thauera sp. AutoDN2]|uniref:hypothetical protein n=1 Tax=Thauera sp. AutoDN2 TaxID=3416051 RepID=UPI003F4BB535